MKKQLNAKSLIAILIIAMIVIANTVVLAADTDYTAGVALTSNSELKEGEIVNINLSVTNINAGAGIDTITAAIEYDKNVFETLSTTSFISNTSWIPSFAAETNRVNAQKSTKITAPETIYTISLKVKSTINVDSTTITLKDIVVSGGILASGGTGDIEVKDASVTIKRETPAETPEEKPEETPKNNTIKDTTTTPKKELPKTGIEQYGTVAIVIVAIIGIFSYVLYKKIAKDVK